MNVENKGRAQLGVLLEDIQMVSVYSSCWSYAFGNFFVKYS